MARIRTIKPEFFTSEDIVALSPLARLLYIATWCEADKEGRLLWKPGTFKLRYLPADACDIEALCNELVQAGLVVLYGDGLAYIPAFGRHQHINPRESASTLPDPSQTARKSTRAPRVTTRHDASARVDDAQGGREGKGKEGKGKEGDNPPTPRKDAGGVVVVSVESMVAAGFDDATAADFIAHKQRLKAPLTARAWADHLRESQRAGFTPQQAAEKVMAKGWKGFDASYVAARHNGHNGHDPEPEWRREQRERNEAFLGPAAARRSSKPTTIDMEALDAAPRALG